MSDKRLIDANALYDTISDVASSSHHDVMSVENVLELIDTAHDVDAVEVVHARWVHEQRYRDSGGWVWRCSACRREAISPIISALKYCHSCGAKMDAKEG